MRSMLVAALFVASPALAQNIVGGSQVDPGDWPDAAAVYFGNQVGCTGVLIHPRVVLTAGHCIGGVSRVKLATNDFTQGGETIWVDQEIEYPNSWYTYDLGILILEQDASTPPRTIAQDCILEDDLYDGAYGTIVGYGAIDIYGNQYTSELREAPAIIDDADCSNLSVGCNQQVSPGGELGAAGDGTDACYGDSGGPMYLTTDRGDYLVGIVSRGYDGVWPPCEHGGIWVRPDAVIDWIETTANVTLAEADCGPPNLAPEPSAAAIEVEAGQVGSTDVAPNDPNPADTHTFSVVSDGEHGAAVVDAAGHVEFTADGDYAGADAFQVLVTDDRGLSGFVWIDVTVTEPGTGDPDDPDGGSRLEAGGCGCATGGSPGAFWLLLLPLLRRKR